MRVDASETSSVPGAEWRVIITAENIAGMHLSPVPPNDGSAPDPIEFITHGAQSESTGVQMEPQPDRVLDTTPPYWFWDSRVSVEAMIPYTVSEDADPGKYEYTVTVFAEDDPESSSKTRTVPIEIRTS